MHVAFRRIQGEPNGPHLLILGGVHGDEFEPMVALRRLLTEIRPERLRGAVTVAPVVNLPAFLRGHRTGLDNLDLARTFPGRLDGSITEQIAAEVTTLIRSADFVIDLHTGGTQLAVLPLVGYMLHPDRQVLTQQRRMARAFNLPVVWGTTHRLDGRSLSACRDAMVPAIYAEHGGSSVCRPDGVDAYVRGCLQVMSELRMLSGVLWQPIDQTIVEDPRDESGHMQVCNPAPSDGYWESWVELGDYVEPGQTLGTVSDTLGNDTTIVNSTQRGTVIVLRTYPRVFRNESLAVILDGEKSISASHP